MAAIFVDRHKLLASRVAVVELHTASTSLGQGADHYSRDYCLGAGSEEDVLGSLIIEFPFIFSRVEADICRCL